MAVTSEPIPSAEDEYPWSANARKLQLWFRAVMILSATWIIALFLPNEYYATIDPVEREDALDVTLPARQLGWVARLLLRVTPDVEVLEPPELADQVHELADLTLARYREAGA